MTNRSCRMRCSILAAVALVAITAPPACSQLAPGAPSVPQISTTGTGEARVTPDRASVTIGVQSRATTAAAAAADNARRQRAVIDTIRALGVPQEQIGTSNYMVSPEMRYEASSQTSRVV